MKSDEERSWMANRGYDDSAGLYYSYDSNVANSKQVTRGDLIVVRHDDYVAGWGIVEAIDVDRHATKEIRRCPSCGKTRWRARVNVVPHVVCDACKAECELDDLIVETVPVVAFRANYAGTWTEAVRPVSSRDPVFIATLKTEDTFNAIRPLDEARLVPLLDRISGRDVPHEQMTLHRVAGLLAGGHSLGIVRRRIGQREFRFKMMERFGERCAFSGEQPPHALEAAHLYSYAKNPVHSVHGGLLLRRDHHALFDANLVTVNPSTWRVEIAPTLRRFETYSAVDGVELQVPREKRPDKDLVEMHYRASQLVFDTVAS